MKQFRLFETSLYEALELDEEDRFWNGSIDDLKKMIKDPTVFEEEMMADFKRYKYNCLEKNLKEYEVDKVLGKQIMTHLQEFFKKSSLKNNTRKNIVRKNKTKRKYY